MKKIHPDFKTDKSNMFEETELPANLKGLIIDSIKKEKRKNVYKGITAAAAVLLMIIVPGYFYLSHDGSNTKNSVAMDVKKPSNVYEKNKNEIKFGSNEQTSMNEQNRNNKINSDSGSEQNQNKSESDSKLLKDKVQSDIKAGNIKIVLKDSKQIESNKETYSKKNFMVPNKAENKSYKDHKSSVYNEQIAIKQTTNNAKKSDNKTAQIADVQNSLRSSNTTGKTSISDSLKLDDNKTVDTAKSTDNQKSTSNDNQVAIDNDSVAKAPDPGEVALAGSSENTENAATKDNVDTNAGDKSNLKMSIMAKSSTPKPVITISFDSNIEIQELENMINEMNIKDYTVKDNQIEINCSIGEYESIKSSLDKTYQDKVKYVEPENIDKEQNTQVKLIMQF
jgi:hypothetical protein